VPSKEFSHLAFRIGGRSGIPAHPPVVENPKRRPIIETMKDIGVFHNFYFRMIRLTRVRRELSTVCWQIGVI